MSDTEPLTVTFPSETSDYFKEDAVALGFESQGRYANFIVTLAHYAREAFENGRGIIVPGAEKKDEVVIRLPRDIVPPKLANAVFNDEMTQAFGDDSRESLLAVLPKANGQSNPAPDSI